MCICICIHIYRERERERSSLHVYISLSVYICIYTCISMIINDTCIKRWRHPAGSCIAARVSPLTSMQPTHGRRSSMRALCSDA